MDPKLEELKSVVGLWKIIIIFIEYSVWRLVWCNHSTISHSCLYLAWAREKYLNFFIFIKLILEYSLFRLLILFNHELLYIDNSRKNLYALFMKSMVDCHSLCSNFSLLKYMPIIYKVFKVHWFYMLIEIPSL